MRIEVQDTRVGNSYTAQLTREQAQQTRAERLKPLAPPSSNFFAIQALVLQLNRVGRSIPIVTEGDFSLTTAPISTPATEGRADRLKLVQGQPVDVAARVLAPDFNAIKENLRLNNDVSTPLPFDVAFAA